MSPQLSRDVLALTAREYRPCSSLDELLSAFLKAAVHYAHSSAARIKVSDVGIAETKPASLEVFVDNFEEKTPEYRFSEDSPHLEASAISSFSLNQSQPPTPPNSSSPQVCPKKELKTSIIYHKKSIGELVFAAAKTVSESASCQTFQSLLARELAFFIKRYQASRFARKQLGKAMLLVGASSWLRKVDQFVERASEVDLPVVISGPFGTEKPQVACAIHFNSSRQHLPLVEINCVSLSAEDLESKISQAVQKAKGGTVFLNGIDGMPLELQHRMAAFIQSDLGQWLGTSQQIDHQQVRWIASTSDDIQQLAGSQKFSRILLTELDFLRVRLAPLEQRPEDIPALVRYALEKYKVAENQKVSAQAMACMEHYQWPENVFELERVVARLATLGHAEAISLDDITQYAPQLVANMPARLPAPSCDSKQGSKALPAPSNTEDESHIGVLVKKLFKQDFTMLNQYHLGIQRSLRYLAKHYSEDLSFSELAEQAFMSSSHLSHLLKAELGESYKTLLTLMRLEKAKMLLTQQGDLRITDVAYESGFGDLSHFTKTFKKVVGCNPKEYRLKGCPVLPET